MCEPQMLSRITMLEAKAADYSPININARDMSKTTHYHNKIHPQASRHSDFEITTASPGSIGADVMGRKLENAWFRQEWPMHLDLDVGKEGVELNRLFEKNTVGSVRIPYHSKRFQRQVKQLYVYSQCFGKESFHLFIDESSCDTIRYSHSEPTTPVISFDFFVE